MDPRITDFVTFDNSIIYDLWDNNTPLSTTLLQSYEYSTTEDFTAFDYFPLQFTGERFLLFEFDEGVIPPYDNTSNYYLEGQSYSTNSTVHSIDCCNTTDFPIPVKAIERQYYNDCLFQIPFGFLKARGSLGCVHKDLIPAYDIWWWPYKNYNDYYIYSRNQERRSVPFINALRKDVRSLKVDKLSRLFGCVHKRRIQSNNFRGCQKYKVYSGKYSWWNWNCYTITSIVENSVRVNQIAGRVAFSDKTTFYSTYEHTSTSKSTDSLLNKRPRSFEVVLQVQAKKFKGYRYSGHSSGKEGSLTIAPNKIDTPHVILQCSERDHRLYGIYYKEKGFHPLEQKPVPYQFVLKEDKETYDKLSSTSTPYKYLKYKPEFVGRPVHPFDFNLYPQVYKLYIKDKKTGELNFEAPFKFDTHKWVKEDYLRVNSVPELREARLKYTYELLKSWWWFVEH
jgi:hypothetical protein